VSPAAAGQRPGHRSGVALAGLARAAARAPLTARALRELLFCVIEVPLGLCVLLIPIALAGLPLTVTLLARGAQSGSRQAHPAGVAAFLGPTLIFVLAALVLLAPRIARTLGAAHRRLADRLLGQRITGPVPVPGGRGAVRWVTDPMRDGPSWRALAYLLLNVPVALLGLYAVFLWVAGLASLSYPFWWQSFRNHAPGVHLSPVPVLTPFDWTGQHFTIATFPGTFAAFAAGGAMVLAAPWVTRAVVLADLWLMRELLGPGRLAQRVADLERTRALAVDDSAGLLRRLERNLHDGAQIRLATLAMNLGMVLDKLGTESGEPDLAAVRELVGTAHRGAKDALAELRDLARGIHPPALDNGLADALATLAAGSPVPVGLATDIPHRPTPAIETIAYFCAAEMLANAVKHSGASSITITVTGQGDLLVLRVDDDGRGGADPAGGSGLAGLSQRVRTVDGRLDITSPAGGPTRVTVELPRRA
jgi:signal transduction histidine kinase